MVGLYTHSDIRSILPWPDFTQVYVSDTGRMTTVKYWKIFYGYPSHPRLDRPFPHRSGMTPIYLPATYCQKNRTEKEDGKLAENQPV